MSKFKLSERREHKRSSETHCLTFVLQADSHSLRSVSIRGRGKRGQSFYTSRFIVRMLPAFFVFGFVFCFFLFFVYSSFVSFPDPLTAASSFHLPITLSCCFWSFDAMKHNNAIVDIHLNKDWFGFVRTWYAAFSLCFRLLFLLFLLLHSFHSVLCLCFMAPGLINLPRRRSAGQNVYCERRSLLLALSISFVLRFAILSSSLLLFAGSNFSNCFFSRCIVLRSVTTKSFELVAVSRWLSSRSLPRSLASFAWFYLSFFLFAVVFVALLSPITSPTLSFPVFSLVISSFSHHHGRRLLFFSIIISSQPSVCVLLSLCLFASPCRRLHALTRCIPFPFLAFLRSFVLRFRKNSRLFPQTFSLRVFSLLLVVLPFLSSSESEDRSCASPLPRHRS